MNEQNPARQAFVPVENALSDAWLQLRSRPLFFLSVWALLILIPKIVLFFVLRTSVEKIIQVSALILSGADPAELTAAEIQAFLSAVGMFLPGSLVSFFVHVVFSAILGKIVLDFRSRTLPGIGSALGGGFKLLPGFLRTVLFTLGQVLLILIPASLATSVLMLLTGLPVIAQSLMALVILIALLNYGLAPFIHLAVGTYGRDSCFLSRNFYKSSRPVMTGLFMVTFLLPLTVFSVLAGLLTALGETALAIGRIALVLLNNMFVLFAVLTWMNFAMNTFKRSPPGEAESARS